MQIQTIQNGVHCKTCEGSHASKQEGIEMQIMQEI